MATEVETLTGLAGEEQLLAGSRSAAYRLYAEAMIYPDDEFCQWVDEGGLVEALRGTLEGVSPGLIPENGAWDALRDAGGEDELAVEYTRLFDAGASGPPCPLYGGLYGGARMKVMEEAVRFYNHFGLTMSDEPRELPDHLSTALEFAHYLAYCEAEALRDGSDAGPYRRAQRDFIERHLGKWIPKLCEKLHAEKAAPYYMCTLEGLAALLVWDVERLLREEPRSS